ncbi:hypothetical protein IWX49DRAFT_594937 [Phyllosticta citricarpa]|uniref:Uncharacterized protein n=1 Tax=Phyllosticta paracitricarpa TaxID=2016321 RepID=A0ABR1MVE5_9PEZI
MADNFGGYINNSYVEAGSSLATTNGPTWRRGPVADPRVDYAVRKVHQAEHENQRVGASLFQFKEQTMQAEIDALRSQLNKAETQIKRHKAKEVEYQSEIQVLENKVDDLKRNAAHDREKFHRLEQDLRRGGKYFSPTTKRDERPAGDHGTNEPQEAGPFMYKKRDKNLDRLVKEDALRRAQSGQRHSRLHGNATPTFLRIVTSCPQATFASISEDVKNLTLCDPAPWA